MTTSRTCPPQVYRVSKKLGDATDEILFGTIWPNRTLSLRDRSLITLAALTGAGRSPQLRGHGNRALDNGVTPAEIDSLIGHLAFLTGWPNAMSAVTEIEQVYQQRGVTGQKETTARQRALSPAEKTLISDCLRSWNSEDETELSRLTEDLITAELWSDGSLSLRDLSLISLVGLLASGQTSDLRPWIALALHFGVTVSELDAAFAQLAFYLGWLRVSEAARLMGEFRTVKP